MPILIYSVFDPGDEFGCLYSCDNNSGISNGDDETTPRSEFIARNVPRSKIRAVQGAMNYLANRTCRPGHAVESCGLYLLLRPIVGEEKTELLETYMTETDPTSTIFEFLPRFRDNVPADWGSIPSPPRTKDLGLVEDILETWRNQKYVIAFKNGNPCDCSKANLKQIDLAVAIKNADSLASDWCTDLNQKRMSYVLKHKRYFEKITKVLFRPAQRCAVCGATDHLKKCSRCTVTWYCGRDHQSQHWGQAGGHKKACRGMADMLDPN